MLAGDFSLVKDINQVPANLSSVLGVLTPVGSSLYFSAEGKQLWKSDATAGGTTLVKSFNGISQIASLNGMLLISASTVSSGLELWTSDGTEAGTTLVKDIAPGTASSTPSGFQEVNGWLYFRADDGSSGGELWKTNGTAGGTTLVKDITVGATGTNLANFANVGGTLYFTADEGVNGVELWKSDGTSAGTVLVKDIAPGSTSSLPSSLLNFNGTLYFTANDGTNGVELWMSDGTSAGTTLVMNIASGAASSSATSLTILSPTVFLFAAVDGVNGVELWKSDGSATGTVLLKDINPGAGGANVQGLLNVSGNIYFSANDGTNGTELWKTDGTAAGTLLLKNIAAGATSSFPYGFANVNGDLFFSAGDGATGSELWKSNGTAAGTVLVQEIRPGANGSSPAGLVNFNGALLFTANDGTIGRELWKSNGTSAGTVLVKDLRIGSLSSDPSYMFNVNGTAFFFANDGVNGRELWKTDGTGNGTVLVKDIKVGSGSGVANNNISATVLNGFLYFAANDGTTGYELWKSDGTAAGTTQVKDIQIGAASSLSNTELTTVNGIVFFTANEGTFGTELWKSDGTAAGTIRLSDFATGNLSSSPSQLTDLGGTLYFKTSNNLLGRSDGTTTRTTVVKTFSANVGNLTNVSGNLFLMANDGSSGIELWKSDGTTNGTLLVKDIVPGIGGLTPKFLTNLNGSLLFAATIGITTTAWVSDGTFVGTRPLRTFASGTTGFLGIANNVAYYTANDPTTGFELWRSDGTEIGTYVQDLLPGAAGSSPFGFQSFNGWAIFSAMTSTTEYGFWATDGTVTRLVSSGFPAGYITSLNGGIYASLGASDVGLELFRMNEPIDDRFSLMGNNVYLVLPAADPMLSLQIKQLNGETTITDQGTSANVIGSNTIYPVGSESLTILANGSTARNLSIDTNSGGMLTASSLDIALGGGGSDALSVIGNSADLRLMQASGTSTYTGSLAQNNRSLPFEFSGAESFTFSGLRAVELVGAVNIDMPMAFLSSRPLNLGLATELSSTLTSSSTVAMGSGESLSGSGNVQARFAGESGSLIQATGSLLIGSATSPAGFSTEGEIEVGTHAVTLRDSNQVILGSLTTLGNGTGPGLLNAANGALIDFGNNLVGYGTLQTPNVSTKPTLINGNVEGTSLAQPMTLSGYIKGVGTLNNVSFTGTYSPGLSPAAVSLGSAAYAASAVTLIEVGGKTAGSQYDQLNHTGQAFLNGTLRVELIDGFVPAVGDSFVFMTASAGITGTFAAEQLPTAPLGTGWQLSYGTNEVKLQLVDLANVATVQFGDGTSQHSRIDRMTITFDAPVTISTGAFNLQQKGASGANVTTSFTTSTNGSGNTVAILTFSGSLTRAGGALLDGYYQFTIDSSKIVRLGTQLNLDGNSDGLAGDNFQRGTLETDGFFALYGDANGDGLVGVAEFGQFRSAFGKLAADPGYSAIMDYDGDGAVGVSDFGQFRSRFGRPKLTF